MSKGVVIVSHVKEIGEGVDRLIKEVAKDVPITVAAGLDQGAVAHHLKKLWRRLKRILRKHYSPFMT